MWSPRLQGSGRGRKIDAGSGLLDRADEREVGPRVGRLGCREFFAGPGDGPDPSRCRERVKTDVESTSHDVQIGRRRDGPAHVGRHRPPGPAKITGGVILVFQHHHMLQSASHASTSAFSRVIPREPLS